ncbi:unnamed protein product [Caenorhabditis auriculariae]|uniref:Uncharacterized protein n=1 Tax=Caenorhabditis auriculariae TaxID=2777116 RepID=A0A8S1HJF3_9PELO|nr:unnamed protein product [Caenorhabditis auriculariae]
MEFINGALNVAGNVVGSIFGNPDTPRLNAEARGTRERIVSAQNHAERMREIQKESAEGLERQRRENLEERETAEQNLRDQHAETLKISEGEEKDLDERLWNIATAETRNMNDPEIVKKEAEQGRKRDEQMEISKESRRNQDQKQTEAHQDNLKRAEEAIEERKKGLVESKQVQELTLEETLKASNRIREDGEAHLTKMMTMMREKGELERKFLAASTQIAIAASRDSEESRLLGKLENVKSAGRDFEEQKNRTLKALLLYQTANVSENGELANREISKLEGSIRDLVRKSSDLESTMSRSDSIDGDQAGKDNLKKFIKDLRSCCSTASRELPTLSVALQTGQAITSKSIEALECSIQKIEDSLNEIPEIRLGNHALKLTSSMSLKVNQPAITDS